MVRSLKHIILVFVITLLACSKEESSTQHRFMYRNDKADMMVYIEGNITSKTFILLSHGGPGGDGSAYNFGTYAKLLEEQYAIVYWDQRGQGASQGKYKDDNTTISQMADDTYELSKLIKQMYGDESSVFLLGHSWGGMLGTAALVETEIQTEIKGWIDADGAHNIPFLNQEAIKMFREVSRVALNQDPSNEFWNNVQTFVDTVDTNNISIQAGGLINEYGHQAEQTIADITYDSAAPELSYYEYIFANPTSPYISFISGRMTSILLYDEVESKSYSHRLDEITIPCLFQWGLYDFVVPPALGYEAFNKVSTPTADKELIIYNSSGHSPMSNEPEKFANDIIAFVERYK